MISLRCRRACAVLAIVWSVAGGLASAIAADAGGRVPAAAKSPATAENVDAHAAASLLSARKEIVVLDVRTPREFEGGHLAGATNIDFNGKKFAASLESLDRDRTYLVYCAVGGRSTASLKTLEKLGFKKVIHLDGGIKAWIGAGKPVIK